jgi:beta-galactosidase
MNMTASGALSAYVFDHAVLSVNGGATTAKSFRPGVLIAQVKAGDRVTILVGQFGRFNAGPNMLDDKKGLRSIAIGTNPHSNVSLFQKCRQFVIPLDTFKYKLKWESTLSIGSPTFYRATFDVDEPADTFFNPTGLDCGAAFVNGIHIGHYWRIGPQATLYVRAQYLKKGVNELVVFETGLIPVVSKVSFDAKVNIDANVISIATAQTSKLVLCV